jgi:hypothetical protein
MQRQLGIMVFTLVAMTAAACRAQAPATAPAEKQTGSQKWEADIAKFEAADRKNMPAAGGIVFVGSSTIRGWDVKKWFPDLPAIQRGFGGSEMDDAVYFVKRIVTKYNPRLVVLYEGDNDIHAGKSPQQVLEDLDRFATALHADVPQAKLIVIAIKPSGSRWEKNPKMRQANDLFREYAGKNNWINVIDMGPDMLGPDGKPNDELFKADRLHLNDAGYKLWSEKLRPLLKQE